MGVPAAFHDALPPKFLLHIILLLGYVRRLIYRGFEAVGLGDLLEPDDAPWADSAQLGARRQESRFWSPPSALLIQEALPVVRYEEIATAAEGKYVGGGCAVCLYEFEAAEEVRRLSNCRHVFHRGCLDRWLEHEQCTCPLCRTPLLPEEMRGALDGSMWAAAAAVPDSYYDDLDDFYLSPAASQSSTMLLLHQQQPFSAY